MAKVKFRPGDIFSFRVRDNEYAAGRILLDVREQCIKRRLLTSDSPLAFFGEGILVEIYAQSGSEIVDKPGTVLIRGMFFARSALDEGDWPIVGHEELVLEAIEFPEYLSGDGIDAVYCRGELEQTIDMHADEAFEIDCLGQVWATGLISSMFLYASDRKDEIDAPDEAAREFPNPGHGDLHYSTHRDRVYALVGPSAQQPYYVVSQNAGFDVARFYR